ncbi:hypothetical protein Tco_1107529 [Tanacetum coccineum]
MKFVYLSHIWRNLAVPLPNSSLTLSSAEYDKAPSELSKTEKVVDVEESIQDDVMDAAEVKQDDDVTKQDMSKWFKQNVVERP